LKLQIEVVAAKERMGVGVRMPEGSGGDKWEVDTKRVTQEGNKKTPYARI